MNKDRNCNRKPGKPIQTGKGSKNQRRAEEVVDTALKQASSNPGSWYERFPTLTNAAGTKAFADITGQQIQYTTDGSTITGGVKTVPGVMSIQFIPAIGISNDNGSAINRSASAVYTYMRGKLKLANDYGPADMMLSYVAFDSMCAVLEHGKRVYGLANATSPANKYYSDTLIAASGFDPKDVRANLDELFFALNKFAIDLASFSFPKEIDLRKRHEWMCSNVYLDAADIKSQAYLFRPMGFWKYNNTSSTGTKLIWTPLNTIQTVASFIKYINGFIDAVRGDEDFSNISGDFYNALGAEGSITISEIPLNYSVVPGYVEDVLAQIENLRCVGMPDASSLVMSQDPTVNSGAILFQPTITLNKQLATQVLQQKWILNRHGSQPSPIEVIEMTRMTPGFNPNTPISSTGNTTLPIASCGADIPVQMDIFLSPVIPGDTDWNYVAVTSWDVINLETYTAAQWTEQLTRFTALSKFDWAPRVVLSTYVASTGVETFIGDFTDYENSTTIEHEELQRMHESAMLSLFDFPRMGFTLR